MTSFSDKKLLAVAIASATLLTACGGDSDSDTPVAAAPAPTPASLTRLATIPLGAELTGMEKTANGELFFNIQHPSLALPPEETKAAVGAWVGVDFNNLPKEITPVPVPDPTSAAATTTHVAMGHYQVLGREGNTYAGGLPFGLGAIPTADNLGLVKQSNNPDFNAFIPSNEDGSEGFLFSAWEDRPGAVSRLALQKNGDSWIVNDALNVDFSGVLGTMINCFGSVSPWGTPLTSEENYEAENTHLWNNAARGGGYPSYADVQAIQTYLGGTFPNPYDYGYIVEITEPTAAAPVPVKHFTLGRSAHENPIIMPDDKTVYLTDDGGFKGFYKFVADTAGDLSAGTLYAAKVVQDAGITDSAEAGFDISWVELGSSNNADIETFIRSFDGIDETDYVDGQTNYVDDADIAAYAAGTGDVEIAFVETLRAAEAKGATTEFNKMEGININYEGAKSGKIPFMYVAMSDVTGSMSDGTGDIAITANRCGIVYRFPLETDFNVSRMEPAVVGGAYDGGSTTDKCDSNGIAQPDNVLVLDDGSVLIGEDTGNHKNNMMWLYRPAKG
ncbi:MAG: DUF839 domain-containing protein [Alcanivoracaceae bacterium]|nr:DUF839 domain-containing protein [Alcanivoracaceae bacterium]